MLRKSLNSSSSYTIPIGRSGGLFYCASHALNNRESFSRGPGEIYFLGRLSNATGSHLHGNFTQATIDDQLERDVTAGKRRLRLNATCPQDGKNGTTGVDDVASPRLTDVAQRDYFILRKRIETSNRMIAGLQSYIITRCLK